MNIKSLYVHIPFCEHICGYCDFTKLLYNEEFASKYVEALILEIKSYNIPKMETIYLGGGTPSALELGKLSQIVDFLGSYLEKNGEFTVEANVENLTKEKLEVLRKAGVNRLSIGVQTTHDEILKAINRHHTFEDAKKVVALAKEYGFTNINVDLIYGLPLQDEEALKEDLRNILSLDTPHISIYSLSISKGSKFYNEGIKPLSDEKDAYMYDLIVKTLTEAGYIHYEVSNFAKEGYESRHNKTYWKDEEYYGCGLGASGYINGVRYTNTKSLTKYLKGEYKDFEEKLTLNEEIEDFLMLNLRLKEGFKVSTFINRFHFDPLEKFKDVLQKQEKEGLITINESIKPTEKGLKLLDFLLRELFVLL